jgi:transposase
MHLKITSSKQGGKIYKYASIVQGYRNGKYVSQKLVKSLGPINSPLDEEKYRRIIEGIKSGEEVITLKEANEKVIEFGVMLVVKSLWDSLEIKPYFSALKITYDINQLIYMLITHRLHNYGSENLSEREGIRWIKEESYSNLSIDLHQVYRGLKILLDRKEKIEKHLCDKLHKDSEIVFYDLTSSYLEGVYEDSDIVDYGYSRDKKIGKKQIILGLLISEGLPIAHKVWEGNTQDRETLKEAVSQLKKLGIRKFIFVADRGLITEPNLIWLENQKIEYLIATKRRRETLVKELMNKKIREDEEVKKVYEEKIDENNIRKYYLCYNKKLSKQKIKELKELKKKLIRKIEEIKEPTEHKVLEILGKNKRLFNLSFEEGFRYSVNKEAYEYEKKIAGKYILVTNNKELSNQGIIKTYKQLMEIERCFRQLKHFEDMRPIFHKSDKGIKAHIFIAVLTLLIEKLINKKIPNMTTREVVTEMKKLKLSKVKELFVRTEITNIQRKILRVLDVEEPPKVIFTRL